MVEVDVVGAQGDLCTFRYPYGVNAVNDRIGDYPVLVIKNEYGDDIALIGRDKVVACRSQEGRP